MAETGDVDSRVSRSDPCCATSEAVAGIDSGPGGSLTSSWGEAGLMAMTPLSPSPFHGRRAADQGTTGAITVPY